MLTDFGRNSFVTWTTGLVERIQKAEKEIQMRPYRGLTKEGKRVYGWYKYHPYYEIHLINTFEESEQLDGGGYWKEFEVIPESVGQFVIKDKNGNDVYAGDNIKIFDGLIRKVIWSHQFLQWAYQSEPNHLPIPLATESFELIEDKEND